MRKIKVLVIGGAGFIGSHLLKGLIESGREVSVLARSLPLGQIIPIGVNYIQGSYTDLDLLKKLLDHQDEVIQLAYATTPNTAFDDPLGDLNQNFLNRLLLEYRWKQCSYTKDACHPREQQIRS